jgi:tetratricopeptide (TPR) repeat protein
MRQLTVSLVLLLTIGWLFEGHAQTADASQAQHIDEAKQKLLDTEARERSYSTEDAYKTLRLAESMYQRELALVWGPDGSKHKAICLKGSSFDFVCITENFNTLSRLQELLKSRAETGDGAAMFYTGLLTSERAASIKRSDPRGDKEYEKAIGYYKQACSAGLSNACWNVAIMYADGEGAVKSGLAAAEWFYKAGVGYLKNGERERALAALESIQKIDKAHPLGKKLNVLLQKGAPQ